MDELRFNTVDALRRIAAMTDRRGYGNDEATQRKASAKPATTAIALLCVCDFILQHIFNFAMDILTHVYDICIHLRCAVLQCDCLFYLMINETCVW